MASAPSSFIADCQTLLFKASFSLNLFSKALKEGVSFIMTGKVLHHDLELIELNDSVLVEIDFMQEVIPLRVVHHKDAAEHTLKLLLCDTPVAVLFYMKKRLEVVNMK